MLNTFVQLHTFLKAVDIITDVITTGFVFLPFLVFFRPSYRPSSISFTTNVGFYMAVCLAKGLINIAQALINVVLGISVKFNPDEKVPCSALFNRMCQLLGM